MRRRFTALVLFFELMLVGVVLATPANAQVPPIVEVSPEATLVADGAAVDIVVAGTCEAGQTLFVGLTVTQAVKKSFAQGNGSSSIPCTGEPESVTVRAIARADLAPFRTGSALVSGNVTVCDPFCRFVSLSGQEVRIRK